MAARVTLSALRSNAKERADMTSSGFVSDDLWNVFINKAYRALYDMLTQVDEDYYTVSFEIQTNGTDSVYGLPSDFYKLNGVDYAPSGELVPMSKFTFRDRNRNANSGTSKLRYRLVNQNIHFMPVPAAQSMTLWYTPAVEDLSEDDDELDGVNGWEEFIEIDAAIQALIKEESDPSALMAERKKLVDRIEASAPARDHSEPEKITDTRRGAGWPYCGED